MMSGCLNWLFGLPAPPPVVPTPIHTRDETTQTISLDEEIYATLLDIVFSSYPQHIVVRRKFVFPCGLTQTSFCSVVPVYDEQGNIKGDMLVTNEIEPRVVFPEIIIDICSHRSARVITNYTNQNLHCVMSARGKLSWHISPKDY